MTKGYIYLVSGPSGAGKDTIIKRVMRDLGSIYRPILTTSRSKRPNEIEGKDYFFTSEEEFSIKPNDFLYYWRSHNFYYGYKKDTIKIQENLIEGKDVIIYFSISHFPPIKKLYPNGTVVLIDSPYHLIEQRLRSRKDIDPKDLEQRLFDAKKWERKIKKFVVNADYVITNSEPLETAVEQLKQIILNKRK